MFLIAGISPKIKQLESHPRRCPVCGLAQAYLKRIDHYLSLFFIPVVRVKKGEPIVICKACERQAPMRNQGASGGRSPSKSRCPSCRAGLEDNFRYCPHCGEKISPATSPE